MMEQGAKNPAILVFVKKRDYIRAAATEFLPDGPMLRWSSSCEHWHFGGFRKDLLHRTRHDVCEIVRAAQEFRGITRYLNQIRVCPLCGRADVTWAGDWDKYKTDPKTVYEADCHDWPLTFSVCRNVDANRCYPYDNMCADQCVHAALTFSENPDCDQDISHAQAALRLGVSGYDTEVWFSELRGGGRRYTFKASEIVEHLFSKVWRLRDAPHTEMSALPDPDDIHPQRFPLKKDAGVYFLFSQGKVIYVGQSETTNSRLKAHKRDGKRFDSVAFLPVLDGTQRLGIERHYIRTINPELNAA